MSNYRPNKVLVLTTDTGTEVNYRTEYEVIEQAERENPTVVIEDISQAMELVHGDCINWQVLEPGFKTTISGYASTLVKEEYDRTTSSEYFDYKANANRAVVVAEIIEHSGISMYTLDAHTIYQLAIKYEIKGTLDHVMDTLCEMTENEVVSNTTWIDTKDTSKKRNVGYVVENIKDNIENSK